MVDGERAQVHVAERRGHHDDAVALAPPIDAAASAPADVEIVSRRKKNVKRFEASKKEGTRAEQIKALAEETRIWAEILTSFGKGILIMDELDWVVMTCARTHL